MNPNFYKVKVLTEELIISKADIDFNTDIEKRAYAEKLENEVKRLLQ